MNYLLTNTSLGQWGREGVTEYLYYKFKTGKSAIAVLSIILDHFIITLRGFKKC